MSSYIDFEIAREYLHKACECLGGNGGMMLKIKFDEAPTADVREVVHGEWIDKDDSNYYCSECDFPISNNYRIDVLNFCPHCGAKMDLKEVEE